MLRRMWIVLLVTGLAISARPAGSRIKRFWLQRVAAAMWDQCRGAPATGAHGEPALWLDIPAAGIGQLVLEGADGKNLARFPCREKAGRAMLIMAHRDTHFQGLEQIGEGDEVQLELRQGTRQAYRVQAIHICDKDEAGLYIQSHTDQDCLLLVTCYPFRYVGPAPRRFVVLAVPV